MLMNCVPLKQDPSKIGIKCDNCSYKFKVSVVQNATGSAYVEIGMSKVICTINGPFSSSKIGYSDECLLECDFQYAKYDKSEAFLENNDCKDIISTIQSAVLPVICVEKYPKSVISLSILVLQGAGNEVSAAIIGASLALSNANIHIRDLVSSVSVSLQSAQPMVNPTYEQVNSAKGGVIVAVRANSSITEPIFTQLITFGKLTPMEVLECSGIGSKVCIEIVSALMKKSLIENAKLS